MQNQNSDPNPVASHALRRKLGNRFGLRWVTGRELAVVMQGEKFLRYQGKDAKQYFWRTKQQQEIDLIEEVEDDMTAYEIKWNPKERVRFSQTFTENYPAAKTATISPGNIEDAAGEPTLRGGIIAAGGIAAEIFVHHLSIEE